jgi:succinate dehydrogenase/fumarate reductase flavoprotein subunit
MKRADDTPDLGGTFDNADVVVLGAGMAGLCAAARAAQSGARVVVLERAPTIGGSAALSHGNIWTVAKTAQLQAEDPGDFRIHASRVVTDFAAAADWLASFGGALRPRKSSLHRQWQRFDIPLTLLRLAQLVTSAGGAICTGAHVADIDREAGGFRIAVRYSEPVRWNSHERTSAGSQTIRARSVVVATGGRQADPAVRAELCAGIPALLRGNPHSDGGGIALAVALGADVNFANRGFYGHLLPAAVTPLSALDFLVLTLYHSTDSVLLDVGGQRFTDESLGDARNATALAARGAPGILLWSAKVQRAAAADPAPVDLAIDRWQYARDRGARVARAETLSAAADVIRGWGFHDFAAGSTPVAAELDDGPVYMTEVRPGITFTYGGLRTNAHGLVLDADRMPIPGLFAAGADMSDIYHQGYCGGLSAAVVTGCQAGQAAATGL